MANNNPLENVGKGNKTLKDYIITKNPQVLLQNEDTGNIIVYMSDGEPFSFGDFENNEYRDLYIGDEHVAGGYGFKNISVRNDILNKVTEEFPDNFVTIDDRLKVIEQVFGSIGDDYNDPNIVVNPLYNTFETSYGVYKLDYQNGELRVVNDVKPNIFDIKLTFGTGDNEVTVTDKEVYNHSIFDPLKLSKITFIYEGTAEPEAFYISHRGLIKHSYEYDIDDVGKYNNPIKMNFTRMNWGQDNDDEPTTKMIKDINSLYFLKNPNKYPNSVQILVEILFNDWEIFGSDLTNYEDEYLLRMGIIDKNNKKVVKTIGHMTVSYPFYFGTSVGKPDIDTTVKEVFTQKFFNNFEDINDMTFYHSTSATTGWLFVPKTVFGVPLGRPTIWYEGDITLKTKWENKEYNCLIGQQDYIVYNTPNMYAGEVSWKIKLEKLM